MPSQLVVRVDPELKDKIDRLARSEGRSTSDLVRKLLEDYVKERDIEGYIDDLWGRIGSKMKEKGFTVKDVDKTISEVRKQGSR